MGIKLVIYISHLMLRAGRSQDKRFLEWRVSQGYENRVGGLSKEPAETRQREKGDRQSTGQVERGRGKTSLPGREKELEERARARRWGDCRQGGAGQRGEGRMSG